MDVKQEKDAYELGYQAGYRQALVDHQIIPSDPHVPVVIQALPIDHAGLSVRAVNCLRAAGCCCIADVCRLDEARIRRMRNLGPRTAAEIAGMIVGYGIHHTAWSRFVDGGGI